MSGPDPKSVSRNWKKLQEKIQSEKVTKPPGEKRKREEMHEAVKANKRSKKTTSSSNSQRQAPKYQRTEPSAPSTTASPITDVASSANLSSGAPFSARSAAVNTIDVCLGNEAIAEPATGNANRRHHKTWASLITPARATAKDAAGNANHKSNKTPGSLVLSTRKTGLQPCDPVKPPHNGAVHRDEPNAGLHPTNKVGKFLALDCEMVGTGPPPHRDNVLACVSLVNFNGEQIYDSYVLPPPGIQVHDYRTPVSGIQPIHLCQGTARPFAEVKKVVTGLLHDRILVGHALRNDLQALVLSHPRRDTRDTSRYPHFRPKKGSPSLRNLAKSELGLTIQTGQHSSLEDARTAMLLFRKEKVGFEQENRREFGTRRKTDPIPAAPPFRAVSIEGEDEEMESDLALIENPAFDTSDIPATVKTFADLSVIATKKSKKKKKKRTKRK